MLNEAAVLEYRRHACIGVLLSVLSTSLHAAPEYCVIQIYVSAFSYIKCCSVGCDVFGRLVHSWHIPPCLKHACLQHMWQYISWPPYHNRTRTHYAVHCIYTQVHVEVDCSIHHGSCTFYTAIDIIGVLFLAFWAWLYDRTYFTYEQRTYITLFEFCQIVAQSTCGHLLSPSAFRRNWSATKDKSYQGEN